MECMRAGNFSGLPTNYYTDLANPVTNSWYNFKGDYNLSAANRISVSGMFASQPSFSPAPDCPLDCNNALIHEETGQLTDVWTMSPTQVNEFRFSVARESGNWSSPDQGQGYPAKIDLPDVAGNSFPTVEVGGPESLSNISGGLAAILAETSFSTSDSVTLIIYSGHSIYQTAKRPFGPWNQAEDAIRGLIDALVENHISVDVIPDWKIETAAQYPLVVVPEWPDLGQDASIGLSSHLPVREARC